MGLKFSIVVGVEMGLNSSNSGSFLIFHLLFFSCFFFFFLVAFNFYSTSLDDSFIGGFTSISLIHQWAH